MKRGEILSTNETHRYCMTGAGLAEKYVICGVFYKNTSLFNWATLL